MTNPPENIICSWSGGKDSCFALMTAVKQGHRPVALLNVLNENGQISRSHGLPPSLLEQQAAALGLPVLLQPSTWKEYETHFVQSLRQLKSTYNATAAVFGDIDLQPHRDWEEKVCSAAGLTALLPLWQQERKVLVYRMLEQGLKCRIVSCNTVLGEEFLGREMDDVLIADLEAAGVDVCGENGEFHTLVTDCPLFSVPVKLPDYKKVRHEEYWFLQWEH
ncbi:Dph6-related ATP pyrophosphatase [Chitinophaga deserti]|uniref:Dph6-related ATP pyrophosphatase n=1 Tax=Chitinophaga deserti TaxID=2164099 RepID=UPI000D6D80BB|nr:diphthine--ammonia ligase [Chitinophaga deserti]